MAPTGTCIRHILEDNPPFLSHFGPEDQLFRRPSANNPSSNYGSNSRPPPVQQREPAVEQKYASSSPPHRAAYSQSQQPINNYHEQTRLPIQPSPSRPVHQPTPNQYREHPTRMPSQQQYEEPMPRKQHSSSNQDLMFANHRHDHPSAQTSFPTPSSPPSMMHQPSEDSKRQSNRPLKSSSHSKHRLFSDVWDELHRTNSRKRESAHRTKGNPPPNSIGRGSGGGQQSKPPSRHQYQPSPIARPTHTDDNADATRNKENTFHRSPAKHYESAHSKSRSRDEHSANDRQEQDSYQRRQPPAAMPRHPSDDADHESTSGGTTAIPLSTITPC